ncbi:hypothetical protein MKZ38_003937 [Zalerion maritima]|uniref:Uncharacterized protein n=1 Tax=Zalerion maritima TaxID=339359 RepID=A0AAD5RN17_9PEZI|nr:hypothetical protein MKZ38_003937 [Zalerion maritima]
MSSLLAIGLAPAVETSSTAFCYLPSRAISLADGASSKPGATGWTFANGGYAYAQAEGGTEGDDNSLTDPPLQAPGNYSSLLGQYPHTTTCTDPGRNYIPPARTQEFPNRGYPTTTGYPIEQTFSFDLTHGSGDSFQGSTAIELENFFNFGEDSQSTPFMEPNVPPTSPHSYVEYDPSLTVAHAYETQTNNQPSDSQSRHHQPSSKRPIRPKTEAQTVPASASSSSKYKKSREPKNKKNDDEGEFESNTSASTMRDLGPTPAVTAAKRSVRTRTRDGTLIRYIPKLATAITMKDNYRRHMQTAHNLEPYQIPLDSSDEEELR